MNWKNRVTDILGSQYPIIQGAFAGFGTSALAAPVSDAGGFGIITAGALHTPEGLRCQSRQRPLELWDTGCPGYRSLCFSSSCMLLRLDYRSQWFRRQLATSRQGCHCERSPRRSEAIQVVEGSGVTHHHLPTEIASPLLCEGSQ